MKKILSMVLVLAIVFSLTACGSSENDIDVENNESSKSTAVETTTIENIEKGKLNVPNMITVPGFLEELPKVLDLDSYTDPDVGENATNCVLYDFYAFTKVNFDYKIILDNGEIIQMPKNYNELINEGWVITDELVDCYLDTYADPSTGKMAILEKNGKEIGVCTMNNFDVPMQLKDCDVEMVEIITKTGYEYDINKNNSDAYGFTICDNITHNTTIEEVFEKYGAPHKVSLSEKMVNDKHSYSVMEIEFRAENKGGILTFEFLVDENKLMSVEYRK